MKTLAKAIGITVLGLILIGGIAILGARSFYGPMGPVPGPELAGSVVTEPVEDWSQVDGIKVVQLETRPGSPYSVNVWLTRVDDGIFVISSDDESSWVQNILQDPRVRLRIGDRIYERQAVKVPDLETKRAFLTAMRSKYQDDYAFDLEAWQRGWDHGRFLLFRMDPRR